MRRAEFALAVCLLLTAIFTIAYWIDFYSAGRVQVRTEEWYVRFERAFPVADCWLAGCCVIGSLGLLSKRRWGILFALLAASALIYLALLDVTFNVQNQLYPLVFQSEKMTLELVINVWTLSLGIATIVLLRARC